MGFFLCTVLETHSFKMTSGAGTQFDPEMVPLFVELVASGAVMPVLDEDGVNEDNGNEDIGKAGP